MADPGTASRSHEQRGSSAISIIVPCFNVVEHVEATIRSALAQDHDQFEVIAVDDGSTDGTAEILARLVDPRLKVIRHANRGAAAARNAGFSASSGRNILFLDGDDLIPPDHLSALEAVLGNSASHIAFGEWDRFGSDVSEARFPARRGYHDALPVDWLIEDWTGARPMTQCGTFLIPRALILRSGGWNEALSLIDDFEFFARLITASDGLRFAPGARVFYRSGMAGSLSGAKSRKAVESALLSLMLGTSHLLERTNSPEARRVCANLLADFDYNYYPRHADLRARARARVAELGGADLPPDGPPGFHALRKLIGWKAARRVQHVSDRLRASRRKRWRTAHA